MFSHFTAFKYYKLVIVKFNKWNCLTQRIILPWFENKWSLKKFGQNIVSASLYLHSTTLCF